MNIYQFTTNHNYKEIVEAIDMKKAIDMSEKFIEKEKKRGNLYEDCHIVTIELLGEPIK